MKQAAFLLMSLGLTVAACSDSSDTDTGGGGSGGTAGAPGNGGMGGDGGAGGGVDLCEGVVCMSTDCVTSVCDPADGLCDESNVAEDTACDASGTPGACDGAGLCVVLCEGVLCEAEGDCRVGTCAPADGSCSYADATNGVACNDFMGTMAGICADGACVDADQCQGVTCPPAGECTVGVCNPADGSCSVANAQDGTLCDSDGDPGTCTAGACNALPAGSEVSGSMSVSCDVLGAFNINMTPAVAVKPSFEIAGTGATAPTDAAAAVTLTGATIASIELLLNGGCIRNGGSDPCIDFIPISVGAVFFDVVSGGTGADTGVGGQDGVSADVDPGQGLVLPPDFTVNGGDQTFTFTGSAAVEATTSGTAIDYQGTEFTMQIDNAGPLGTLVLSNVIDGADLMGDPVPPFCTITSSDVLSTP